MKGELARDLARVFANAEYEVAKAIVEMDAAGIKTGRRHALAAVGQLQKARRAMTRTEERDR
jgi:hypothetical protein